MLLFVVMVLSSQTSSSQAGQSRKILGPWSARHHRTLRSRTTLSAPASCLTFSASVLKRREGRRTDVLFELRSSASTRCRSKRISARNTADLGRFGLMALSVSSLRCSFSVVWLVHVGSYHCFPFASPPQ